MFLHIVSSKLVCISNSKTTILHSTFYTILHNNFVTNLGINKPHITITSIRECETTTTNKCKIK